MRDDVTHFQDESAQKRVNDPASPDRCQAKSAMTGQCSFVREPLVPENQYCRMHGGKSFTKATARKAISQYNLTKFKAEVERFASHDLIFSLRDEIGIERMMIETLINKMTGPEDLIIHSAVLGGHLERMVKIVATAKKLESQLGELLDRAAIQRLCDGLVSVLADYVPQERLPQVADRFAGLIAEAIASRTGGTDE